MLKKITEPQAIYEKNHIDGTHPVHSSFTTPPKKSTKFNKKIAGSIIAVFMVAVVGIAGVMIAQRQQNVEGPVAPNAPESIPQAAIEPTGCSVSFIVPSTTTPPPPPAPGSSRCTSKTATLVGSTVPLTSTSKVPPGSVIEYTITTTPTGSADSSIVISDTLPPQLEYKSLSARLNGSSNVPPSIFPSTSNNNTLTYNLSGPAANRQNVIKYQATLKSNTPATVTSFTNAVKVVSNPNTATPTTDVSCKLTIGVQALPTGVARCESKTASNPVTKTAYTTTGTSVSSIKRGEIIEYKLIVSAERTTKGTVVITDTLPLTTLEYQTGTATGVTAQPTERSVGSNKILTFTVGTLASSGTKQTLTITYKAKVKADAPIANFTNDAKVVTAADATTASACKATLTVTPVGTARCESKTALSASGTVLANEAIVKKGDILTYRLKVTATETTNGAVKVTDVLPASVTYDSPITAGVTHAAGTVTADLGVMGSTTTNKEKIIEFKVKVKDTAASGDFVNTAAVTTGGIAGNSCPVTLRIAYACNTGCITDAQCASAGTNFICSAENGNTCRLSSNPTSASCEGAAPTYSCNSSCENDTQCQGSAGSPNYVCANTNDGKRCRLKDSETQVNCQATSTPTPTPTIGCNVNCSTNADCTNPSHICYTTSDGSQKCRLDTNPSSASCVNAGTPVASTIPGQPELPEELPQTGPEDWINWLKAGLITLGIGAALLLLL